MDLQSTLQGEQLADPVLSSELCGLTLGLRRGLLQFANGTYLREDTGRLWSKLRGEPGSVVSKAPSPVRKKPRGFLRLNFFFFCVSTATSTATTVWPPHQT